MTTLITPLARVQPVARIKPRPRPQAVTPAPAPLPIDNPRRPASPATLKWLDEMYGRNTLEEKARWLLLHEPATIVSAHPNNQQPMVMEGRGYVTVFCSPALAAECGR